MLDNKTRNHLCWTLTNIFIHSKNLVNFDENIKVLWKSNYFELIVAYFLKRVVGKIRILQNTQPEQIWIEKLYFFT